MEHLSFAFSADREPLFDDVSLVLQPGVLYLLVGPNGAGKSTFFRLCRGDALQPGEIVEGTMNIGGREFVLAERGPMPVFYVPQRYDDMLVAGMTVRDNLTASTFDRIPGLRPALLDARLAALAEQYDLPLDGVLSDLSGGQRQLVSLCMALVKDKPLILFDEPTASLDTRKSERMFHVLSSQARERGVTVIASCHDQAIIQKQQPGTIIDIAVAGEKRSMRIR